MLMTKGPGRLGGDGHPSGRPRLHQLGAWWRAAGAGRLAPDGGRGRDGLGEPPVGTDGGPARRSRADVLDRRPGDDDRLLDLAAAGLLPGRRSGGVVRDAGDPGYPVARISACLLYTSDA